MHTNEILNGIWNHLGINNSVVIWIFTLFGWFPSSVDAVYDRTAPITVTTKI